uniref:Ras association domain family member 7 n=1 Tax=Tetraodon nigroviridis TaxID=99883 RepID=H3CCB4_TETNG
MELKVWVDGALRVVCGLTLSTSCRDVVVALAQSLGQTGRYLLVMKLRESERQLEADDCPLQHLARLGQLSAEVQFHLRRTSSSFHQGPNTQARESHRPRSRGSQPQSLQPKASGSSTHPRRTNPNRTWSPASRTSPEPGASPLFFLNLTSSKEEVFRHVLQQQQRLQDLQVLLQGLEREAALWEGESTSGPLPTAAEQLEEQRRRNEAELLLGQQWEEELQAETDRERELHRRLQQIQASLQAHGSQTQQLQQHAQQLQQDLALPAPPQAAPAPGPNQEEVLKPLQQELQHRLQQAQELDATLSQTQGALQAAEQRLQDRWRTVEELSRELRQWKLQQFIQQSGGTRNTSLKIRPAEREREKKEIRTNIFFNFAPLRRPRPSRQLP